MVAEKKYILHVESYPSSPERADEFNKWYEEVHLPDCLAVDGYVSAVRYAPVDGEGPYITQYTLAGDPHQAVANMRAASAAGKLNMSDCLQLDPVPVMKIMEVLVEAE